VHAVVPSHDNAIMHPPKKVLILYSFHDQMPWQTGFKKGLHHFLADQHGQIALYEENLDATRFSDHETNRHFYALLLSKYTQGSIDLIVTEGGPASDFLHRHPLFLQKVPRLFVNPSPEVIHTVHEDKHHKILAVKGNLSEALYQIQTIFQPQKIIVAGETKTDIAKQLVNEIRTCQQKSQ